MVAGSRKVLLAAASLVLLAVGATPGPTAAPPDTQFANLGTCEDAPVLAERSGGWTCMPKRQDPERVRAVVDDVTERTDAGR